jgi:transcriptional regulator with XRE-family HTH domain
LSGIGERLRFWREGIPKTLDELELETGIPKSNLSYYETKAKNLPEDARDKLKTYGAPLGWILTGEGREPVPSKSARTMEPAPISSAPKPSARDMADADRYLEKLPIPANLDRKERFEWLQWLAETIAEKRALNVSEKEIEERVGHLVELARRYRASLKRGRSPE